MIKATVLLQRGNDLCDWLEMEYEEGVYITYVEAETEKECFLEAAAQVWKADKKNLAQMGVIGYAANRFKTDYTFIAMFEGHPAILQHGGVTHPYDL